MDEPTCVTCKRPILPEEARASRVGIGAWYHDACWNLNDDEENSECTHCGGEGWQHSDDPLWDGEYIVACCACAGTGLQTPEHFLMNPTRDALRALIHEFAHSARGDHLTAALDLLGLASCTSGLYVLERLIAECTRPQGDPIVDSQETA